MVDADERTLRNGWLEGNMDALHGSQNWKGERRFCTIYYIYMVEFGCHLSVYISYVLNVVFWLGMLRSP